MIGAIFTEKSGLEKGIGLESQSSHSDGNSFATGTSCVRQQNWWQGWKVEVRSFSKMYNNPMVPPLVAEKNAIEHCKQSLCRSDIHSHVSSFSLLLAYKWQKWVNIAKNHAKCMRPNCSTLYKTNLVGTLLKHCGALRMHLLKNQPQCTPQHCIMCASPVCIVTRFLLFLFLLHNFAQ